MKNFNYELLAGLNVGKFTDLFGYKVNSILTSENPCCGSNPLGHITASGLVVRNGEALLIFHPHIKRWLQPGGHIDEGESPVDAAIREVYEETGLVCISEPEYLDPIDIDVHLIPSNPKKGEGEHIHIDLLFLLKVVREESPLEEMQFKWVAFERIECGRIQRALLNLS